MSEKKAITHTKSVRKRAVHQTIELQIEKFELLMKSYKPGEDLWSEGVTSELAPQVVWKLRIYPSGDREQSKGHISVFLQLTEPMKDNGEDLDATFHVYLVDGSSGSKIDVAERRTDNFNKEGYYGWGQHVDHARVKKALRGDGSLLVAADVSFLVPDGDGGVEPNCKESPLRGDETQKQPSAKSFSEPLSDHAPPDPTSEIEKLSIEKVLSAENVVVMALHPGTNSLETLKEACIKLIVRKGETISESAAWKELREVKPELAFDLIEEATAVLAEKK